MPIGTRKGKCDRCNKQKTDLELCSDDLLCRPCEIANAVELTKIQLRRDTLLSQSLFLLKLLPLDLEILNMLHR